MKLTSTLFFYLARIYASHLILMLIGLLSVIYLFDTIELVRRASKIGETPFSTLLGMAFLNTPKMAQIIAPFAILFAALLTFWTLARRSELVIARASGLSAWQFLYPVISVAFLAGIAMTALVNPLSAIFAQKFQHMEDEILSRERHLVKLFDGGLWLRQEIDNSYFVLHAEKVKLPEWRLTNVMVLKFDHDDIFKGRIDASAARIDNGAWIFENAIVNNLLEPAQSKPDLRLPTTLTRSEIEESFSDPEMISFWKMMNFAKTLEATGFDATRLRIYFMSLLATPFLFMAMVLMAATVGLKHGRMRRSVELLVAGILTGFIVFFLSNFLQALGSSQQIPGFLAAWTPALLGLLISFAILLHQEDG